MGRRRERGTGGTASIVRGERTVWGRDRGGTVGTGSRGGNGERIEYLNIHYCILPPHNHGTGGPDRTYLPKGTTFTHVSDTQ